MLRNKVNDTIVSHWVSVLEKNKTIIVSLRLSGGFKGMGGIMNEYEGVQCRQ